MTMLQLLYLVLLMSGCLRILTTVYSSCCCCSGALKPLASHSPTRTFSRSAAAMFLSLCAAVRTFRVGALLLLEESEGITAQVPTKSLSWTNQRSVLRLWTNHSSPGLNTHHLDQSEMSIEASC